MKYRIILENSNGCELDERFARGEEAINDAVRDLIQDCVLAAGDVIRIVEV